MDIFDVNEIRPVIDLVKIGENRNEGLFIHLLIQSDIKMHKRRFVRV